MRISPDCRHYAFVAGLGPDDGDVMVTVVDLSTGQSTPIAPGHSPRWVSDTVLQFQPQNGSNVLEASFPHWRANSTSIPAGNSLAVAWLRAAIHRTDPLRIIDNVLGVFPGYASPAFTTGGSEMAVLIPDQPKPHMQSIGLINSARQLSTVYEGAVTEHRIANNTLVWRDANGSCWGIRDVTSDLRIVLLARPEERVSHLVPVAWNNTLLILHNRDLGNNRGQVCLGEWSSMALGSPLGYKIAVSGGGGFDHDAQAIDNVQILTAWLRSDGRAEHRIVSTNDTAERLFTSSLPTAYDRSPDDVAPVAVGRWVGYFYTSGRYGSFTPKANVTVLGRGLFEDSNKMLPDNFIEDMLEGARKTEHCFVQAEEDSINAIRSMWSRVAGILVHEPGDRDELIAMVTEARALCTRLGLSKKPVIAVLTTAASTDPTMVGVADTIAAEIYTDGLFDFDNRKIEEHINSTIEDVLTLHRKVILVPMAYDRGLEELKRRPQILEAMAWCSAQRLNDARVLGILAFAYSRPTGVLDHEELEAWYEAIFNAVRGVPGIPGGPVPPPTSGGNVTEQDYQRRVTERVGFVPPQAIMDGAANWFYENAAWERDQIPGPKGDDGKEIVGSRNLSRGVWSLYWPVYMSELFKQMALNGIPGAEATWGDWSFKAVSRMRDVYWQAQGKPDRFR